MSLSRAPGSWRWEQRLGGWWRINDHLAISDGPHDGPYDEDAWRHRVQLPQADYDELTALLFAVLARMGADYPYAQPPLPGPPEAVELRMLLSWSTALLEARMAIEAQEARAAAQGDERRYCSHRWAAPRVEVPDSVPVNHVCELPEGHLPPHHCSCGADERQEQRP